MPEKSETPHYGGASRKCFGGCFRDDLNLLSFQAQFLIAMHNLRPELAVMIAALAFGGGVGHG